MQIGQQHIFAQSGADSDGQTAGAQQVIPAYHFLPLADGLKSGVQMLIQKLSVLRQGDSTGTADQQGRGKGFLQPGDGFAHGGLADIQFFGGGGNITALSHGVKDVIQVELVHGRYLSII